jgi:hypothetical protein
MRKQLLMHHIRAHTPLHRATSVGRRDGHVTGIGSSPGPGEGRRPLQVSRFTGKAAVVTGAATARRLASPGTYVSDGMSPRL